MLVECAYRTLIIDDDVEIHNGIKFGLGEEYPLASAYSGEEAIRLAKAGVFPVVIVDLLMEGISGIETMEMLRATWPYYKFIILTGHSSEGSAIAALNKGAFRYFLKPFPFATLRNTIALAYQSYEREVSLDIGHSLCSTDLQKLGLTPREADIAAGILQNKVNATIATELEVSVRTVEKHCERILVKTGISSRAELKYELRMRHRSILERRL